MDGSWWDYQAFAKIPIYIHDFTPSGVNYSKYEFSHPFLWDQDVIAARQKAEETVFRWIHLPLNDINVVKACIRELVGEDETQFLWETWAPKRRPTATIPNRIIPNHAWYLDPSFQIHSADEQDQIRKPGFTLFLPYLNFERFSELRSFSLGMTGLGEVGNGAGEYHKRRTLDEFFYDGLQNTEIRDAGQTLSKWTGDAEKIPTNGRRKAEDDSLIVMVDQMWVWGLDDGTLVSCFPHHDSDLDQSKVRHPWKASSTDIMSSIMTASGLERCLDGFDLAVFLATHSVTDFFNPDNKPVDILSIYRWAAVNKVGRHAEQHDAFWRRKASQRKKDSSNEETEDLILSLEIADILDELNILKIVLQRQSSVMARLFQSSATQNNQTPAITPTSGLQASLSAHTSIEQARQSLGLTTSDIEDLEARTKEINKKVRDLLDLEQKFASVEEARASTKQGQAVMLFTIVTIIFLPLSFFASYFGQNVSDVTGNPQDPKAIELWKTTAIPVSIVVIILPLLAVYFIINPWKLGINIYYNILDRLVNVFDDLISIIIVVPSKVLAFLEILGMVIAMASIDCQLKRRQHKASHATGHNGDINDLVTRSTEV